MIQIINKTENYQFHEESKFRKTETHVTLVNITQILPIWVNKC